jgi:hypothetical protein
MKASAILALCAAFATIQGLAIQAREASEEVAVPASHNSYKRGEEEIAVPASHNSY